MTFTITVLANVPSRSLCLVTVTPIVMLTMQSLGSPTTWPTASNATSTS